MEIARTAGERGGNEEEKLSHGGLQEATQCAFHSLTNLGEDISHVTRKTTDRCI